MVLGDGWMPPPSPLDCLQLQHEKEHAKGMIKQLGCEICPTSDNVNPISFKKPIVRLASHVRSPKLINNDEVNVAFLNALPDKTTWLEAIGSDQIKLVEGVIDLISRGFNKGGRYEQAVAVIRDICTSKGWDQEALAIDAHDNLARAHYLAKSIPRFRSKWGTKTWICPYCRRKFVNGVTKVTGKYVAERCKGCAKEEGIDSVLYSPGCDENGVKKCVTFKGRSYLTSVEVRSFV